MSTAALTVESKDVSHREPPLLFPPFRLDPIGRCLWNGSRRVPLTYKSFGVLNHLIRNTGRPVSKNELLEAIWPDTFVGDAVLKVCIAEIRKALGDVAQDPLYIQTLHRQGYLFIAKTQTLDSINTAPIERETALNQLRGALKAAASGKRQIVFVTGEAGIGKTTLVDAFLSGARLSETVRVAQAQCLDQQAAPEPYFVLLDALSSLTQQVDREHLAALLRQHAPTWLAELPSLISDSDRGWLSGETIGAKKDRMLREFTTLIEALASEMPLILVLEDLHWSDSATVDAIGHLARHRLSSRLLFLATYRPEELILGRHPLRQLKQELQLHGQCTELPLEFLTIAGIGTHLSLRFPGCDWVDELAAVIHDRTDGNPLLMVNVVDLLLSSNAIVPREGRWGLTGPVERIVFDIPQNVQEMVERQLMRVTPEEQTLLGAASTIGSEFSTGTLAVALGNGADVSRVEDCCQSLARRGYWLAARDSAQNVYRFVHELYRRALGRTVPGAERAGFHLRVAEYMERTGTSSDDGNAFDLAMHFEAGRSYSRAVGCLICCAQLSAKRHAVREALQHLEHGCELLEKAPADERIGLEGTVLEQRGLVKRSMDDVRGAAADFENLEAFARAIGRPELEIRALLRLSAVLFWLDHKRCVEIAERAVRLSRDLGDPDLLAQSAGYLSSRVLRLQGWRDSDFDNCCRAVEAARRSGDRDFLGLDLMSLANFFCHRTQYAEACEAADEGMELALTAGDGYHYISCQYFKAWALLHAGRWGEALFLIRTGLHLSERNGNQTALTLFRALEAWIHIEAFNYEAAGQLAERALSESSSGFARFLTLIILGRACIFLDDLERAAFCLGQVQDRQSQMDWAYNFPFLQASGELRLARGDWKGACTEANRLMEIATQSNQKTYLGIAGCIRAEAAYSRGEETDLSHFEDCRSPMVEWRLHAIAAKFAQKKGSDEVGRTHISLSRRALESLSQSVAGDEPLGASIRLGMSKRLRQFFRGDLTGI